MAAPTVAAAREHALAVTRNYISQPRLSEWVLDRYGSLWGGGGGRTGVAHTEREKGCLSEMVV